MFELLVILYIWYCIGVATTAVFEVINMAAQIGAPESIRRATKSFLQIVVYGVLGPFAAVPGVYNLYRIVGIRIGLFQK